MESYAFGATIRLRGEFRDPDTRELEDPLAAVVCTVTRPDGSEVTPAVTRASLGVFDASVTPTAAQQGTWHYRFAAGAQGADPASAESGYFLVRD